MKTLIFLSMLSIPLAGILGQSPDQKAALAEQQHYLRKAREQKEHAWITYGIGTALLAGGIIAAPKFPSLFEDQRRDETLSGFLVIGGGVLVVASVPIFISAAHNKRKAASLSLGHQMNYLPDTRSVTSSIQPAMTFSITF